MIGIGMAMRLNATKQTPTQRAINILTSSGPGAWYDPSDIANYTAAVGPELVPSTPSVSAFNANGTVAVVGDVVTCTCTTNGTYGLRISSVAPAANKSYRAAVTTVTNSAGGAVYGDFGGQTAGFGSVAGAVVTHYIGTTTAAAFTLYIIGAVAGETFSVNLAALSVKELTGLSACTMFQDSAGTTPVTAVEQPVGLILDKSGGGNHAIQPTATSRPTLRQDGNGMYHLAFDGVDDSMYTAASIDFTSTDKMTVFAGVHKASDAGVGALIEYSADASANSGAFSILNSSAVTGQFRLLSRGTVVQTASDVTVNAPATRVLSAIGDISGDSAVIRGNGAQTGSSAADQGAGNYGNYPLYVGRRNNASLPFNGRVYQLALKGKALSAAEISTLESYINSKTKAY